VTIPYPTMNGFWRSWLYQLNPYTRLWAMVSTELRWLFHQMSTICLLNRSSGLVIRCQPDEFSVFNPPANQTCSPWAQDFVNVFGGYLDNPSNSSDCRYCQFAVGDQFFVPLNVSFSNRWRDAFIIFAFFSELLLVSYILKLILRCHYQFSISL
jgi:ATP-binding cassette, subfamily G (WHITE), member 2, SNQ2